MEALAKPVERQENRRSKFDFAVVSVTERELLRSARMLNPYNPKRDSCASAGGPLYYTGRDMAASHKGMGISANDWEIFLRHLQATLDKFQVPESERRDVLPFVESTRGDTLKNRAPSPSCGKG